MVKDFEFGEGVDNYKESCEDVANQANDKVDAMINLPVKKRIIAETEFEQAYEELFETEDGEIGDDEDDEDDLPDGDGDDEDDDDNSGGDEEEEKI